MCANLFFIMIKMLTNNKHIIGVNRICLNGFNWMSSQCSNITDLEGLSSLKTTPKQLKDF